MYAAAGDGTGTSTAAARWRRVGPRLRAAAWRPRPRPPPPRPDYSELARQQFKEYLENACVHGLKYIGRSDQPTYVRVLWAFLVLACLVGLAAMTHVMSANILPTRVTVAQTRVDVRDYPFPSITVCPVANIQKSIALASLRLFNKIERRRERWRPLSNASALPEEDVNPAALPVLQRLHERALRALQEFRYPLFSTKWSDLDSEALESLGNMNPRDLLMLSFPPCQQLFSGCSWKSNFSDCCDLFDVQETNAGLCYAFNSCTSMSTKSTPCRPRLGEPDDSQALLFSTMKTEPSEVLSEEPHSKGIVVVVANPFEIPVPANGHYYPEDGSANSRITSSVTVQDADDDIRWFPWTTRECKFRDEGPLDIAHVYTQAGCVEACRLRLVADRCECLPLHFSVIPTSTLAGLPPCNASRLQCVFEQKYLLRNLVTAAEFQLKFGWERRLTEVETVECACPPECDQLLYDADFSTLGTLRDDLPGLSSIVYVRQKNLGASNIRYLKTSRVSFSEALATLGNLASLFLGVSVLSVLEFLWVSVSCLRTLSMKWCSTQHHRQ